MSDEQHTNTPITPMLYHVIDGYMIFTIANDSSDMDFKDFYSEEYLAVCGLENDTEVFVKHGNFDITDKNALQNIIMYGGYFQPVDDLTHPYQEFVRGVEGEWVSDERPQDDDDTKPRFQPRNPNKVDDEPQPWFHSFKPNKVDEEPKSWFQSSFKKNKDTETDETKPWFLPMKRSKEDDSKTSSTTRIKWTDTTLSNTQNSIKTTIEKLKQTLSKKNETHVAEGDERPTTPTYANQTLIPKSLLEMKPTEIIDRKTIQKEESDLSEDQHPELEPTAKQQIPFVKPLSEEQNQDIDIDDEKEDNGHSSVIPSPQKEFVILKIRLSTNNGSNGRLLDIARPQEYETDIELNSNGLTYKDIEGAFRVSEFLRSQHGISVFQEELYRINDCIIAIKTNAVLDSHTPIESLDRTYTDSTWLSKMIS